MRRVGIARCVAPAPLGAALGRRKAARRARGDAVQDAPLFVADEPTAHLAPEAARRLHALLTDARPRPQRSYRRSPARWADRVHRPHDRARPRGHDRCRGRAAQDFSRQACASRSARHLASGGVRARRGLGRSRPCISRSRRFPSPRRWPISIPRRHRDYRSTQPDPSSNPTLRPAVRRTMQLRSADAPVLVRLEHADCAPFLGPTVLRGIDLSIHEGEILGVLGRERRRQVDTRSVPRRPPAAEGGTTAPGRRAAMPSSGRRTSSSPAPCARSWRWLCRIA